MAKRKITKRVVDSLSPGDIVWDTVVRGYGVRRQRDARVYVVKYRFGGRQRWYRIGEHGAPWTAEKARTRAESVLGDVADGNDPAAAREAARDQRTIAELCECYLADYAEHHKRPSTVATDRINIENHIKPLLGRLNVADITRADVDRFKRAVKDGKTAKDIKLGPRARSIVRGGEGAANRCLALLSHMFSMAERWGWRAEGTNPCRYVEKYRENRRERFLSEAELACLGHVLAEAEQGVESPFAIAAVRLLIFTGARVSEILSLRWEHVDLERAMLRLPDSKTGAKAIYLSAPALEILATLPHIDGNPHVIAGERKGAPLVNLQKPWRRLRQRTTLRLWAAEAESRSEGGRLVTLLREKLDREPLYAECVQEAKRCGVELPRGLEDVRLHDLRHSFASVGAAGGLSLPMIGRLLGHTQTATTQRYAHLAADPVKAANEAIGQRIAAMMKGGEEKMVAEILPMAKRGP